MVPPVPILFVPLIDCRLVEVIKLSVSDAFSPPSSIAPPPPLILGDVYVVVPTMFYI